MQQNMDVYRERRDAAVSGLKKLGFVLDSPKASFYIWFGVPDGLTSKAFCAQVLEQTGVVVTPGNGFGDAGEGYARMALTLPTERIVEAVRRIGSVTF